ncbi:MAG TPA: histidine phosphatase family protein [Gaiellaceae bacterium]|nr:histidine phosphatase family protein [Gaiellaceae bacterium]
MRLAILARHGESEYSARGRLNGDAAVPCGLTARGREEARRLGEALRGDPLELCVTSALQRARETADEALGGRDVPRLVLPELNDPLYGPYEGGSIEEYRAWAAAAPSSAAPEPGGESRLALVRRYARGFRTVLERPEEHVLVVCHSLPVSYALEARAGRPPAVRMPLVAHAAPYPFSAGELESAVAVLERWAAAPTW